MEQNVGESERWIRIGLGVAFVAVAVWALAFGGGLGVAAWISAAVISLVLAAVMGVTASVRKSPVNHAVGRNTYSGSRE